MKKLFVFLLFISTIHFTTLALAASPEFTLKEGKLYNAQNEIPEFIEMIREYDMVYVADTTGFNREDFIQGTYDGGEFIKPAIINPSNVISNSFVSGSPAYLKQGSVFYIRHKFDARYGKNGSKWQEIELPKEAFIWSTTATIADLPSVVVTANSFTVTPKNIYTEYEYAIITDPKAEPVWKSIGTAEKTGSIIEKFKPISSLYSIYVRIKDDNKKGFLFKPVGGVVVTEPRIWLEDETIGPLSGGKTGTVWFVSTKEGSWNTVNVEAGQTQYFDLEKIIGKKTVDVVLKKYEKVTGQETPEVDKVTQEVLRATIAERPAIPKEIKPLAFVSNAYPENWTLEGASAYKFEYSLDAGATWNVFDAAIGLPLLTVDQQKLKTKAAKILFKIPCDDAALIPSSDEKAYTQVKQLKAPSLKLDYKNETVKCKDGTAYYFSTTEIKDFSAIEFTMAYDVLDVSEYITNCSFMYFYTVENGKKSRSGIYTIIPAKRASRPVTEQAFDTSKSKIKLFKGIETADLQKTKWGGIPKGEKQIYVRIKATAKFNAKAGNSTGFAASTPVIADLTYDETEKNIISAKLPDKKTLNLYSLTASQFQNCSFNGSFKKDVLEYTMSITKPYDELLKPIKGSAVIQFTTQPKDGESESGGKIESAKVNINTKQVLQQEGVYTINDLVVGDVISIILEPVDKNEYGTTTVSIKVVEPALTAPSSVAFGTSNDKGKIKLVLAAALTSGKSANVKYKITHSARGIEKVIFEEAVEYKFGTVDNLTFELDCSKQMSAEGAGAYTVEAYLVGKAGETSDSTVCKSGPITVTTEQFNEFVYEVESSTQNIVGNTVKIKNVINCFGSTQTATFEWFRDLTASVGKEANYVFTQDDVGKSISVKITVNGIVKTYTVNGAILQ